MANGTGDASFSNISLTGSSAHVTHYTLSLGSGSMLAEAPITINYTGTAVAGTRYTLIVFEDGLSNWSTLFSTAYGTLSYANNTLYLTYTPVTKKTHGSDFSAIDSSLSNAALLFDGKSPGNVSVNGQVSLSSISVSSGSYVWQDGTTSGSLHVADCISLSGNAIVESRLATLLGNQIELSGSSQLILNSGGTSVISRLTASLKTTVNVASGCVIFDDVTSLGALQVAEGAEAQFRNTGDLRISGDVTARGSLVLLNGGERDLVTYTFGNGILPFSNVTIGSSSFTTDVSVSLAAEGSPHGSYTIMGDGELRLLRDGVFSLRAGA